MSSDIEAPALLEVEHVEGTGWRVRFGDEWFACESESEARDLAEAPRWTGKLLLRNDQTFRETLIRTSKLYDRYAAKYKNEYLAFISRSLTNRADDIPVDRYWN